MTADGDAARREREIAEREAELAERERRAAKAAATPVDETAHLLAAEVFAEVAEHHEQAAAELEADELE
jgi:hypothetical protein